MMISMKKYLKRFTFYEETAKLAWALQSDLASWKFTIVSNFPGELGAYLRSKFVPPLFQSCGKKPYFAQGLRLENPGKIICGDFVRFGVGVFISGGGNVILRNNVLLGPYVQLWSINHKYQDPRTNIVDQGYSLERIIIGDGCWIGANSQILPGVIIGHGSVLGAGTVLRRSVRPFSIVQGNPGRVVGYRISKEEYFKLPDPSKEESDTSK